MTPEQQRIDELEENLQSMRLTLDTLLENLLSPALMVPGTLRFGGNAMQLDHNGIQIATEAGIGAIYFSDSLDISPEAPYAFIMGAVPLGVPSLSINAQQASDDLARVQVSNAADDPQVLLIAQKDSATAAQLVVDKVAFAFSVVPIFLPSVASDPTGSSLVDSAIWYNSTSDSIKARVNGATVTLVTSATAAPTDADYLVGTANSGLSNEIVVGTSPGGELGGTWASPTVDATHSGSAHSAYAPLAGATFTGNAVAKGANFEVRDNSDVLQAYWQGTDGALVWGSGSDVNLYRSAANVLQTSDQLVADDGFRMKTKAGVPSDSDLTVDADGVIILDTTNHRLYIRDGGAWKYAALT